MRSWTALAVTALVALTTIVSATPAFTPVPNRRTPATLHELAKRGAKWSPSWGKPLKDVEGVCFEIDFDEWWEDLEKKPWAWVGYGNKKSKPNWSGWSVCICIDFDDTCYSPQGRNLPNFSAWPLLGAHLKKICTIPEGAIPNPKPDRCCSYTCPYGACGDGCLQQGQTCQSGRPVWGNGGGNGGNGGGNGGGGRGHRRSFESRRTTYCPRGGDRCPTTDNSATASWECVDTKSDVESCGGCLYADPFNRTSIAIGRDCTQIPDVAEVSCRNGQCVVEECMPGYENVDGKGCVYSEQYALRLQKYRL